MTDERGRWFRVYARQMWKHPKFHDLTAIELGAWLALRSECELRDNAVLTDRADAILILRRRRVGRPGATLDRLMALRLFDLLEDGALAVHDRADHDRGKYPSDEPEATAARKRKSREVTTRDINGHDTRARDSKQQAASSIQPQQASLPSEDDSATFACRLFPNGGEWLSNREYVAAWDDMDRRYTSEWVQAEIQPAYAAILASHEKVKPWDLKRMVDLRCAERTRAQEKERELTTAERDKREADALREKADSATEEEREKASIVRRAVKLWIAKRPDEPVPTAFEELRGWLEANGATA